MVLRVLINVALVLVTFRVMPESVDVDLTNLKEDIEGFIATFGGVVVRCEKKPIAFGLQSLDISFSIDEQNSNLDPLEDQIRNVHGVESVQAVDVRRAIG